MNFKEFSDDELLQRLSDVQDRVSAVQKYPLKEGQLERLRGEMKPIRQELVHRGLLIPVRRRYELEEDDEVE